MTNAGDEQARAELVSLLQALLDYAETSDAPPRVIAAEIADKLGEFAHPLPVFAREQLERFVS